MWNRSFFVEKYQLSPSGAASADYQSLFSHDNLIKRHFKPLLAEIDVEELVWHSLRHFAVSTWIEQGLSAKSVQTYAGHSSLSVTMDRYGHMFPNEEHKARMDAIAGEILGLPQKRT
ncbi:MAG: hypothetical protein CBD27_05405 [Rhodospirillaceae bacterium TMED167]|nr:hypothetical protein [Rhodospirillaceae bacterium]OUW27795.1 MAG: hypothetical protein CBD27_05405 [Rhodospirillaceae bacterium TMED167]